MKKNIHPKYQQVLFVDSSTGYKFVCGSTMKSDETDTFEGKEYPVSKVSISSASHPFFTGSKQLLDAEGRVDKFKKRYAQKTKEVVEATAEQPKDASSKDESSKEENTEKAPAKKKVAAKK